MQWVASEKQGTPPAGFVGGFQLPQMYVSLFLRPSWAEPITDTFCRGPPSVLFIPPLTMFTGLWLRICFGFGSQQQTVTITTPGIADIQFASTPTLDAQHPYVSPLILFSPWLMVCRPFLECGQFRSIVASCSYLENRPGFPDDARQRAASLQSTSTYTYRRVRKTSRSKGRTKLHSPLLSFV